VKVEVAKIGRDRVHRVCSRWVVDGGSARQGGARHAVDGQDKVGAECCRW
jgi:hypothetical protein